MFIHQAITGGQETTGIRGIAVDKSGAFSRYGNCSIHFMTTNNLATEKCSIGLITSPDELRDIANKMEALLELTGSYSDES